MAIKIEKRPGAVRSRTARDRFVKPDNPDIMDSDSLKVAATLPTGEGISRGLQNFAEGLNVMEEITTENQLLDIEQSAIEKADAKAIELATITDAVEFNDKVKLASQDLRNEIEIEFADKIKKNARLKSGIDKILYSANRSFFKDTFIRRADYALETNITKNNMKLDTIRKKIGQISSTGDAFDEDSQELVVQGIRAISAIKQANPKFDELKEVDNLFFSLFKQKTLNQLQEDGVEIYNNYGEIDFTALSSIVNDKEFETKIIGKNKNLIPNSAIETFKEFVKEEEKKQIPRINKKDQEYNEDLTIKIEELLDKGNISEAQDYLDNNPARGNNQIKTNKELNDLITRTARGDLPSAVSAKIESYLETNRIFVANPVFSSDQEFVIDDPEILELLNKNLPDNVKEYTEKTPLSINKLRGDGILNKSSFDNLRQTLKSDASVKEKKKAQNETFKTSFDSVMDSIFSGYENLQGTSANQFLQDAKTAFENTKLAEFSEWRKTNKYKGKEVGFDDLLNPASDSYIFKDSNTYTQNISKDLIGLSAEEIAAQYKKQRDGYGRPMPKKPVYPEGDDYLSDYARTLIDAKNDSIIFEPSFNEIDRQWHWGSVAPHVLFGDPTTNEDDKIIPGVFRIMKKKSHPTHMQGVEEEIGRGAFVFEFGDSQFSVYRGLIDNSYYNKLKDKEIFKEYEKELLQKLPGLLNNITASESEADLEFLIFNYKEEEYINKVSRRLRNILTDMKKRLTNE